MEINDRVYGKVTIIEPVLIKLINSKPVQRLKGVNQAGASQYVFKHKNVTRYEHSIGVMILLKKLGASVEEQIAGLLHDTPHTAFSHVIDHVFKNDDHTFHEKFHEKIILNSEIPEIIKEFGYDTNRILDESNFPLLEKHLPDLCADRIDYTLRDMTALEGFSDKIAEYVTSFIIKDNEIIIADKNTAKKFTEDYMRMGKISWAKPFDVALFQILADAIKIGLDKNILTEDDLFEDDNYVYSKLKNSNEKAILKKLAMLNPNLKIVNSPDDYDFYAKSKVRFINPKFLTSENSIKRITEEFPEFIEKIEKHKEWTLKGTFIKIVSY